MAKSNKLFGHWDFSFARAVLRLNCDQIAPMYGYSPHTWRKYEENSRNAPQKLIHQLEEVIQEELKIRTLL